MKFQTLLSEVNSRLTFRLLLVPAVLLTLYIVVRAAWLSFTIDESTSWLWYASPPGFFPAHPDAAVANHHLLNSWLMKLFASLFGSSELVLRLPNVLAGMLYFYVAILFAQKFPPLKGVLLFVALTCHPYVLQYFSMARGYGLAMAALLAGLYFAWRFWQETRSRRLLLWTHVAMVLAVVANLATVHFVLPFLGLQFVFLLAAKETRSYGRLIIALAGVVLIAAIAWMHGSYLEKHAALHWGGTTGIWEDSISSLYSALLYDAGYSLNARATVRMFLYISCGLIFIAGVIIVFRRKQPLTFFPLMVLSVLGTMVFILVLHHWRGTLFPLGRTGLFLAPVFILTLMLALNHAGKRLRPFAVFYSSVFCTALLVHMALNANLRQTLEWYYEADSKIVAKDLHELDPEGRQRIYCDWLLSQTLEYYRTHFTFMSFGPGSNGVPDPLNEWALIDVWRHGFPDPRLWKMHRCYANNLVLFERRAP